MEGLDKLKIFIVDDDQFYLNIFSQYLSNLGVTDVALFDNGLDALNKLHDQPQVVFLDHNMDDITGYEVLKKIKRYNPDIYVVMITAQEDIKTAVDSLKHGAFDYIQKGQHDEERVKAVLEKILEIKKMLEQSNPGGFLKRMLQFVVV